MIDLKRVTYFLADGRPVTDSFIRNVTKLVDTARKHFNFSAVKIGCPTDPKIPGAEWVETPVMLNLDAYSRFCLYEMADHVDSEFVLVFQEDGFIVNPDTWDDSFLNYDYIGSPWPQLGMRVGNGGFSLRSKRLLQEVKKLGEFVGNEDWIMCFQLKDQLEKAGMKWAPLEVARKFSIEYPVDDSHLVSTSFGQHSRRPSNVLGEIRHQNISAEVREVLNDIVELGYAVFDSDGAYRYIAPKVNLWSGRWRQMSQFLQGLNGAGKLSGEFFVCLFDGWREYAHPSDEKVFVPWSSVDKSLFLGKGTCEEPRFVHACQDTNIFPIMPHPVIAFNRHTDDANTLVIPDPDFIDTGFKEFAKEVADNDIPWERKVDLAIWRGRRHVSDYKVDPVLHARDRITRLDDSLLSASYSYDTPISEQLKYKFIVDVEGTTSSWSGLYWKLLSNSLVIRIKSHWENWYSSSLINGENCVVTTIEDLPKCIRWCVDHPVACERMAANGTKLARKLNYQHAIERFPR